MFHQLYAGLVLAGLLIASYTDLRTRTVSNKLSFGLILAGVVLHAIESGLTADLGPILFSLGGGFLAFAFAFVLYKVGAWAGGDVKLFAALGFLVPMPYGSVPGFYHAFPLFPFTILINSVLLAFPAVMAFVFLRTATEKRLRRQFRVMLSKTARHTLFLSCSILGYSYVLSLLALPQALLLVLIIVSAFLPRLAKFGLPGVLTIAWVATAANVWVLAVTVVLSFLVTGFFEAITYGRKHALVKRIAIKSLEEGMIVAQTLYLESGRVKTFQPSFWTGFAQPKHVIASCLSASGLTPKQISALKKAGAKSVLVKESVPMVPIVLLGSIASFALGDLLWLGMQMI